MQLTDRQRRALDSICDTFVPGGNGMPAASEVGVADALVAALERNPRRAERRQLLQLLSLWDTRGLTALGGGGLSRFSALPPEDREKVLLSWADSRLGQRRAAFQALRKGVLAFYWMLPGPEGARHPAWDAIGYPGPLGPPDDPPPRPLRPALPRADTTLDCDVCVVGSGAGGGTAAGVLAGAGLDVVVLEAGGYYDDADFEGSELEALTGYYASAPLASSDQSMTLVAGACLGGGTVVNYTTSFRTPDDVREEWAGHGVADFAGAAYDESLDAVSDRLGVNQEHNRPSTRDRKLEEACAKLGWHMDRMPRNVRGCDQGTVCGYCGLGCQLGAKQSVAKTWLVDAERAGARLLVRTRAERVLVERGAARGVEARTMSGHRVTVRARAVVAAAGAIQTPALLKRSGLGNPNVGRHLRLHPVTAAFGVFDEDLRSWEGTLQAVYSDQHRFLDGGYGVKYETAPMQPHLFMPFAPWRGARAHADLMHGLSHTVPMGIILRDRDAGEVRVGRDGEPVVRYRLSEYDARHVSKGFDGAAELLEAAGARRIFSAHARWVTYAPGADGDRARFVRDCDAAGYGSGRCHFVSFHLMGSARMGGSSRRSACNPDGRAWDARGLYVCDGSTFPTASGVNPMISIEAIAHMNARKLAAALA